MSRSRIHPDAPLTSAEKQRRFLDRIRSEAYEAGRADAAAKAYKLGLADGRAEAKRKAKRAKAARRG
jgi:hypothetical protein